MLPDYLSGQLSNKEQPRQIKVPFPKILSKKLFFETKPQNQWK